MNDPQQTASDRIQALEEKLTRVMTEHQQAQRELAAMRAVLLRQASGKTGGDREADFARRLAVTEQEVQQTTAVVKDILHSRIWKTLQSGGGFLLNLQRTASRLRNGAQRNQENSKKPVKSGTVQIHCDTLPQQPEHSVFGIISIQGWAAAPAGVTNVEIAVDSGEPFGTVYVKRPDVEKYFPEIPAEAIWGFEAKFNTTTVSSGIHTLKIQARTKAGELGELEIAYRCRSGEW